MLWSFDCKAIYVGFDSVRVRTWKVCDTMALPLAGRH